MSVNGTAPQIEMMRSILPAQQKRPRWGECRKRAGSRL